MSKPEEFTFTQKITVKLQDADGRAIREGSVLQSIEDNCRRVVTCIKRVGDRGNGLDAVGDIHIQDPKSPGSTRVTNRYAKWRHIPKEQQTYHERFGAWFHDKTAYDYAGLSDDKEKPEAEKKAISGIMALLPDDTVCWETGPWPDTIEQALRFLVDHLEALRKP